MSEEEEPMSEEQPPMTEEQKRERFESLSPNEKWQELWWADLWPWDYPERPKHFIPALGEYAYLSFTDERDRVTSAKADRFIELCQQALDEGADVNHRFKFEPEDPDDLIDAIFLCTVDHKGAQMVRRRALGLLLQRGASLEYVTTEWAEDFSRFIRKCIKGDEQDVLIGLFDCGLSVTHPVILEYYGVLPNGRLMRPAPADKFAHRWMHQGNMFGKVILPRLQAKSGEGSLAQMAHLVLQKSIRLRRMDPTKYNYLLQRMTRM